MIKIKESFVFCSVCIGIFLVSGCAVGPAPVYQANFNIDQKPQMSLPEAFQSLQRELMSTDSTKVPINNISLTNEGFSFENHGNKYVGKYDDINGLIVNTLNEFSVDWTTISGETIWHLTWASQGDAQAFVDAVLAMKYYASKQSFDDPAVFADFQERAKEWLALPQKPPLPEEARRFRVLADDAVLNKEFDKAANYYEQGLAIDPMWPAGQFNAAMIYKELNFYSMAVMHMKRYLELKPGDLVKYRDQMYIWEEKAGEDGSSGSSTTNTNVNPQPTPTRGAVEQKIMQGLGTR